MWPVNCWSFGESEGLRSLTFYKTVNMLWINVFEAELFVEIYLIQLQYFRRHLANKKIKT